MLSADSDGIAWTAGDCYVERIVVGAVAQTQHAAGLQAADRCVQRLARRNVPGTYCLPERRWAGRTILIRSDIRLRVAIGAGDICGWRALARAGVEGRRIC